MSIRPTHGGRPPGGPIWRPDHRSQFQREFGLPGPNPMPLVAPQMGGMNPAAGDLAEGMCPRGGGMNPMLNSQVGGMNYSMIGPGTGVPGGAYGGYCGSGIDDSYPDDDGGYCSCCDGEEW